MSFQQVIETPYTHSSVLEWQGCACHRFLCSEMELMVLVQMVLCLSKRVVPVVCSLSLQISWQVSGKSLLSKGDFISCWETQLLYLAAALWHVFFFKKDFLERLNSAFWHTRVQQGYMSLGLLSQQSQRVGREHRGEKVKSPQGHVFL